MAKITAPQDLENDGLYADEAPTAQGGKEETESTKPEDENEEEEHEGPTAVIDTKVLMGKDGKPPKEGDEVVLKVLKLFGDNEAEVAYSPTPPKSIPAEKGSSYEDELDQMNKEE